MVDYLSGRVSSNPQTFLAQGAGGNIPLADFPPLGIVAFGCFRVAVKVIIALGLQLGMLLAEPAIGQPGAAGVGAGALGLSGHQLHHHLGIREANTDLPPRWLLFLFS